MENNFLHIYKKLHPKDFKDFAKLVLEQKSKIIHEIKDFTILNLDSGYYLVNKQSLDLKHFDTKEEAVNKALDFYKSALNIQTELFK